MKQLTKLITTLALLVLLLLPASSVRALGPFDDGGPVIFGGSYTLASGDTLNSDLVVFGGNVTIEEDATVNGSIVIFGGVIRMDGLMSGDMLLIGGSGTVGGKAVVQGDLVTIGASVNREEGATIAGTITNNPTIEIPVPQIPGVVTSTQVPNGVVVTPVPGVPQPPTVQQPNFNFNPLGSAFSVLGAAILFAAFAMLLVLFMHPQMDQVAGTVVANPLVAGGVGLLAIPATFLLMVILLLTIIGPVALMIAFFAAWLFGIVSIGNEVGERFTRSIGQDWAPALTAGFGTFLLVLIAQGIGQIPCIGWFVPFTLGLIGLGGVVLTVLNRYSARRQMRPPMPPPAEPLPPVS
jgi:hypothetical protein